MFILWLIARIAWLVDCLIIWLIDWLTGGLTDWLIDPADYGGGVWRGGGGVGLGGWGVGLGGWGVGGGGWGWVGVGGGGLPDWCMGRATDWIPVLWADLLLELSIFFMSVWNFGRHLSAQGVVWLTFRELPIIISRKYTKPEITFMVRISS